jgi:peptidyl-prolyl cis-trans isomerase B (cyclophilin B)
MKSVLVLLIAVALMASLSACQIGGLFGGKNQTQEEANDMPKENPTFIIQMEDGSVMKGELYPRIAPNSVANFIQLANSGFYDGLIFHRVIPGFMIQGGDPSGNGTGGPGYSIAGEFKANGFDNTLKHTKGVLSWARSSSMNSAGSQFFIMAGEATHLDGQYAAFGIVTEGLDVVDKIVSVKRNASDKPLTDQRIAAIRVETYGEEYPVNKLQ